MVEISDLNLFLGTILDSFMKKGYVSSTPSQDSRVKKVEGKGVKEKNEGKYSEKDSKTFQECVSSTPEVQNEKDSEPFQKEVTKFARNNWKWGVALATGFALGPPSVSGVIGLLGFGSAGVAVAAAHSVGVAGLGHGGVLVSGSLGAAMANAISKIWENPKGLEELEKFVTISATITGYESVPTKLTFDMHHQLLTNEEVLKTFFHGFDTAKKSAKSKQFEFLVVRDDEACEKGCLALREHLKKTYGDKYV